MKISIPTDQELGQKIESIARAAAVLIAFFYAAGFSLGHSIHWLSANLTTLHRFMIHESPNQELNFVSDSSCVNSSCDRRAQARKSAAKGFG